MSNESYDRYHPNRSCTYPRFQPPASVESTEEWGRKGWRIFHQYPLNFRPGMDDQRCYQFYRQDFLNWIKCDTCRSHYLQAIQQTPIKLYTMEDLFAWTVEIHNQVNRRIGKPVISLCEAERIWFPQSFSYQTYPESRSNGYTTIYLS